MKAGFVRLSQNSLFSGRYISQFNVSLNDQNLMDWLQRHNVSNYVTVCTSWDTTCGLQLWSSSINNIAPWWSEVTAKITQWLSLSMKKERPGSFKCLTWEVQGDHLVTCAAAWASWTQGAQAAAHGELTGRHTAWTKNWPLAGRHWRDSTLEMVGNVAMAISNCTALHQSRK